MNGSPPDTADLAGYTALLANPSRGREQRLRRHSRHSAVPGGVRFQRPDGHAPVRSHLRGPTAPKPCARPVLSDAARSGKVPLQPGPVFLVLPRASRLRRANPPNSRSRKPDFADHEAAGRSNGGGPVSGLALCCNCVRRSFRACTGCGAVGHGHVELTGRSLDGLARVNAAGGRRRGGRCPEGAGHVMPPLTFSG